MAYGRREIFMLRAELSGKIINSHEELLDMFRDNFTAVLLACESGSGSPKEFYSVTGSLGDEVYVSNGSVCWFTKDIIASSYLTALSSLTNMKIQPSVIIKNLFMKGTMVTMNNEVSFEEAKFMLVSCSAFVNYLISEYGKINGDQT